jgi:hypothetical protein
MSTSFVVQPRLAGHGPTLFAGLSKRVDCLFLELSIGESRLISADQIIGVLCPHNWVVVSENFDLPAGPFRWIHSLAPTR